MSAALSSAASLGATPTPGSRLASDAARTLGRFLFGSTAVRAAGRAPGGRRRPRGTSARTVNTRTYTARNGVAETKRKHTKQRKWERRSSPVAGTTAPLFSCLILNFYAQLTINEAADALLTPRCGADVSRAGPSSRRHRATRSLGVGDTLKTREASTFISLYTKSEHCCYPLLLRLC